MRIIPKIRIILSLRAAYDTVQRSHSGTDPETEYPLFCGSAVYEAEKALSGYFHGYCLQSSSSALRGRPDPPDLRGWAAGPV